MKTSVAGLTVCILFVAWSRDARCATASVLGNSTPTVQTPLAFAQDASAFAIAEPIFDSPGDGALWVRGADYKARFDEHGLQFIPFLGADAPANHPVDFAIASATIGGRELDFDTSVPPEREGDRVVFHRGALDEIYVVGAHALEQILVLREPPTRGALTIRMRAASDLALLGDKAGVRFENELGGVNYGRATTLDANDRALPTLTRAIGGLLEIRIPSEATETARFPLTIDPLISSFSIVSGTNVPELPDLSYDLSTDIWVGVYQNTFSSSDHDVLAARFTNSGASLGSSYIDVTSSDWTKPRVANNNAQNQFMVVAQVAVGGIYSRISVRTLAASDASMGPQIVIASDVVPGNEFYNSPDIGGDPYPYGAPCYCVAYLNGSQNLWCARVTPSGTVQPRVSLTSFTGLTGPVRISKSNGDWHWSDQRWTVAFLDTGGQLRLRQIALSGQPTGTEAQSAGGSSVFAVSPLLDEPGPSRRFLLAEGGLDYVIADVSSMDVNGALTFGTAWGNGWNFTEGNGITKTSLAAETDGTRFFVVYGEPVAGGQNDLFMATYSYNGTTGYVSQSHVPVVTFALNDVTPCLASKHTSGGISTTAATLWKEFGGQVKKAFYNDAILGAFVN